jgi:subtilisin family serine protease
LAREAGDEDVVIAVIDTGFDLEHPQLVGRWTPTETHGCFPRPAAPPVGSPAQVDVAQKNIDRESDGRWHGTAVAGIIAASSGAVDGTGSGCSILPIKVTNFTDANIAAALRWAVNAGARVVNLSLSSGTPQRTLQAVVREAWRANRMVICASAGNGDPGDRPRVIYPAAFRRVLAVGASIQDGDPKTPQNGDRPWFSRYGQQISVLAPGVQIDTTDVQSTPGYDPGNRYAEFAGTSAASPHVAGLTGLLYSAMPPGGRGAYGVNTVIRDRIERTAERVGGLEYYPYTTRGIPRSAKRGYGLINADAAVP